MLCNKLRKSEIEADKVLAVSSSGLGMARRVAQEMDLPLKGLMSVNIHGPGKDAPVVGAVCQEGTIYLDDRMIEEFMIDREYVSEIAGQERRRLKETVQEKGLTPGEIKDENILLVTDGISSGLRASASLGAALKKGVGRKMVATPLMSQHAEQRIAELSDDVYRIREPRFLASVKDGYASSSGKRGVP